MMTLDYEDEGQQDQDKDESSGNTVIRKVAVKITDALIIEKAKACSALQAEIAKLEDELKGHKSRLTKDIESKTATVMEHLKVIGAGVEEKVLDCLVKKNHEAQTVEYHHEGVVVDSRPMNDNDRQLELPRVTDPVSAVGTQSEDEAIKEVYQEDKNLTRTTLDPAGDEGLE